MSATSRWLLAIALVAVDLLIFVAPLTGIAAGYLVIVRPPWFRAWIEQLYEDA